MDAGEDWTGAGLEKATHELAEKFDLNHKKVVIPIFFAAIMGKHQGPPLFDSVHLARQRQNARTYDASD